LGISRLNAPADVEQGSDAEDCLADAGSSACDVEHPRSPAADRVRHCAPGGGDADRLGQCLDGGVDGALVAVVGVDVEECVEFLPCGVDDVERVVVGAREGFEAGANLVHLPQPCGVADLEGVVIGRRCGDESSDELVEVGASAVDSVADGDGVHGSPVGDLG
jgi:hypothetical protein